MVVAHGDFNLIRGKRETSNYYYDYLGENRAAWADAAVAELCVHTHKHHIAKHPPDRYNLCSLIVTSYGPLISALPRVGGFFLLCQVIHAILGNSACLPISLSIHSLQSSAGSCVYSYCIIGGDRELLRDLSCRNIFSDSHRLRVL